MDQRPIPAEAREDPNAWEPLRVWIAGQRLHCTMKIGAFEENGVPEDVAWGILLADTARHVADALAKAGSRDRDSALAEISRRFVAECAKPSSDTSGNFVE